jgi:hypothetical protein
MAFFTKLEKAILKFMEAKKTLSSQRKKFLWKKDQCWRYHNTRFQIILPKYSKTSKQKLAWYWHIDTNRTEQRTQKQTHAATAIWYSIKMQNTYLGEKTALLINGTKKLNILFQKTETRSLFLTL